MRSDTIVVAGGEGPFRYLLALIRAYHLERTRTVRMMLDGDVQCLWAVQLGVGNGRCHGAGFFVSETVSIRDGKLDICGVVHALFWRLISGARALLAQAHDVGPLIDTSSAKRIEISTSHRADISADGELIATTPACVRVHRAALTVLTPTHWNG